METTQAKIISLEVSPFTYEDYCQLFEKYNNDVDNIELRTIINCLGFNIDRPTAIITKADGDVLAPCIASSRAEVDEYLKDAVRVQNLGLWTTYKYSNKSFQNAMSKLFNHSCKIDYKINVVNNDTHIDEIIYIRRIYTMSSRLGTVQMVEFIHVPDDESNNVRNVNISGWMYFDIHYVNLYTTMKDLVADKIADVLANKLEKITISKNIMRAFLYARTINLYNLILNKYMPAIKKIYDFYIEQEFEEIDDKQMWEHPLFQTGIHLIDF